MRSSAGESAHAGGRRPCSVALLPPGDRSRTQRVIELRAIKRFQLVSLLGNLIKSHPYNLHRLLRRTPLIVSSSGAMLALREIPCEAPACCAPLCKNELSVQIKFCH